MSVLDARSLNRAALARQLLLDRADRPVPDAVAHLGGMQAQEPQEPFVGLWSRLRDFAPRALDDLLAGRRVVRTHLMRRTVHLVTAEDVLAWRSRHDAMLRGRVLGTYRRELAGVDLDELAAAGRAVLADGEPRSMGDLPPAPPGTDPVGAALVRRYLAAFGPAASADLRAWCGLAGLPAAVAAVRGELVAFRDERGRELLDLPDAPRPGPDAPAPVRFLPAFDNAVLGYQDRGRIIDDAHRGLSVTGARFVLVDGRVSATWTVEGDTVTVTPLRRLTRPERAQVVEEGRALASFLSEGDSDRVMVGAAPPP
ncbi:winged helix DNA-binding domain-containing protein [Streptomyces sp. MH60]|uniref:winged helix DNA-binding domain-containing protein n=1 Tax=Streptomyces sp. MH60 TaxID=1940758 RepID=UPI000CEE051F|nr:winged helix DNA-binding domain-containing protein [Streptomyces sp. MH60]PPS86823.1 hypothetical protein BZZ08_03126 [Streptomyces sp. MH60]